MCIFQPNPTSLRATSRVRNENKTQFLIWCQFMYYTKLSYLLPIVCKSCETEYRSIYKTVYELAHVKKCHDMPKKICQYLDEKVCRISRWSHKEICQYETMENCYKKHEEICHSHSHKVPKSEEVIVPKTVCYQSYLGFVEGEK